MADTSASTRYPLYLTPTHPHFWPLRTQTALNVWVGKQFVSTTGRYIWSVSGPLPGTTDRQLHYCEASATNRNFCLGDSFSWERWARLDNLLAKVLQFGGTHPGNSHWRYPTRHTCTTRTFPGMIWPSLGAHQTYAYRSLYTAGDCRPGGYVAVVRDTYTSKSGLCQWLLSPYPVARAICDTTLQVHLVYQGYHQLIGGLTYTGVEAVVYISGYAQPVSGLPENSLTVRRWFRNGEVRFSMYKPLAETPPPAHLAEAWWRSRGIAAFHQAENFIYTGVYKLGSTTYFDSGVG
jgi:hypothetical protein